MLADVGTFIILQIERNTGTEIITEMIQWIEIQSSNCKRARHKHRALIFRKDALFPCSTIDNEVIGNIRIQCVILRWEIGESVFFIVSKKVRNAYGSFNFSIHAERGRCRQWES